MKPNRQALFGLRSCSLQACKPTSILKSIHVEDHSLFVAVLRNCTFFLHAISTKLSVNEVHSDVLNSISLHEIFFDSSLHNPSFMQVVAIHSCQNVLQ